MRAAAPLRHAGTQTASADVVKIQLSIGADGAVPPAASQKADVSVGGRCNGTHLNVQAAGVQVRVVEVVERRLRVLGALEAHKAKLPRVPVAAHTTLAVKPPWIMVVAC